MKQLFPEYYRPTEEEFRTLWESCVFSVDASVLLNVYGYSDPTREDLLSLLESLANRIWMPHQFALEYQRNRAHAIMEQVSNYLRVEKILTDVYNNEFSPKTKHPFLSDEAMNLFKQIRKDLENGRKKHEALFSNDPYFDQITKITKHVSSSPTEEQLAKLYAEAQARFAKEIPPGYADLGHKKEPQAYGDYIGWTQLMDIAKAENKPLILVTDDAKPDWWQIQAGRTIGPRPELRAEFRSKCQTEFYMYSSNNFMTFARKYLKQKVEDASIQEVSDRLLKRIQEFAQALRAEPKLAAEPPSDQKPLASPEPPKPAEQKPIDPPVSDSENPPPSSPDH